MIWSPSEMPKDKAPVPIVVLGVPFGSKEAIKTYFSKAAVQLEDPKLFCLLRYCLAGQRVNHLLRVLCKSG